LKEELDSLQQKHASRFKVHYVLEEPPSGSYEKGFVTADIIQKYLDLKSLIMVCGPPIMEDIVTKHLNQLGVSKEHQIAFTKAAESNIIDSKDYLPTSAVAVSEYTMEEVSKHNVEGDCWLVISDKVYDITKFVDEHPGGYIILDGAGKDATQMFEVEFPHSPHAFDDLDQFQIGILKKINQT